MYNFLKNKSKYTGATPNEENIALINILLFYTLSCLLICAMKSKRGQPSKFEIIALNDIRVDRSLGVEIQVWQISWLCILCTQIRKKPKHPPLKRMFTIQLLHTCFGSTAHRFFVSVALFVFVAQNFTTFNNTTSSYQGSPNESGLCPKKWLLSDADNWQLYRDPCKWSWNRSYTNYLSSGQHKKWV